MSPPTCPVCFEALAPVLRATAPCGHTLCLQCLLQLRPPVRCPLCREALEVPSRDRAPPPLPSRNASNSDSTTVVTLRVMTAGAATAATQTTAAPPSPPPRSPAALLRRLVLKMRYATALTEEVAFAATAT